ncbi:unnamed protein product, partial [Iphiclides podalirius]
MQARAGGEAARRRADRGSAYFRAPSREPQLTGRVSVCACSEWNVLGRMRILLSELGLSGGCLDLTLEPRAASLDPDKPAPGQRPNDVSQPSNFVFIFAFAV